MARALPAGAQAGAGGEEEEGAAAVASVGGPVPAGALGAAVQTGADVYGVVSGVVMCLLFPSRAVGRSFGRSGRWWNCQSLWCGPLSQLSLGAET